MHISLWAETGGEEQRGHDRKKALAEDSNRRQPLTDVAQLYSQTVTPYFSPVTSATYSHCPNRLLQRMESLKQKPSFFDGRSMISQHSEGLFLPTDRFLLGFIDQQHTGFQHTPQFSPVLGCTT